MKNLFSSFLPVLILLVASPASAGTTIPYHPFDRDWSYQAFDNIDLPQESNIVNTVFQDDGGMIWFGTKMGLYSYNGHDFFPFLSDKNSARNYIYSIIRYDSEHLCLATDDGLSWFNVSTESYEDFCPELNGFKNVRSLALFDDKLWIGTRDWGLFTYDPQTKLIESSKIDGRDETIVYSLEPAGDLLFVGTYEGLSCYDSGLGIRTAVSLDSSTRVMVNSLLWDDVSRSLWVGTEGRLLCYDHDSATSRSLDSLIGHSVKSLALDEGRLLLIGTDSGLFVYSPESGALKAVTHDSRNTTSLSNNVVWDILQDRDGNIWFATDRGVSLSRASVPFHYIHLSEIVGIGDGNLFTYMTIDSQGDYWLGGESGLIHILGNNSSCEVDWFRQSSSTHVLRHNRVRHLYEDRSGRLWLSSDGGVAHYDRRADCFVFHNIIDSRSG